MEKNEKESMELEVKTPPAAIDDEPEINYRGLKAMPFIIGEPKKKKKNLISLIPPHLYKFLLNFFLFCFSRK